LHEITFPFFQEGNNSEIYIYKTIRRQLTVTLQLCNLKTQIHPLQQEAFTNKFRTVLVRFQDLGSWDGLQAGHQLLPLSTIRPRSKVTAD